jgi:anti-sigma regulatory factor (Ser/Thr protein kinase)
MAKSSTDLLLSLNKNLSAKMFSLEKKRMPSEEIERSRMNFAENLLPSINFSFSFTTTIFPKPLKLSYLTNRITELLEPLLPTEFFFDVRMAIEEVAGNILEHSYNDTEEAHIYLHFTCDSDKVRVLMEDYGEKGRWYDFEASGKYNSREELRKTAAAKRGGMGVYLVRKVMDEVTYSVEPGKYNRIEMTKFFQKPQTISQTM